MIRWEARERSQRRLCGLAAALAVPLAASFFGVETLRSWVAVVARAMESHTFREVTGYGALGLMVVQNLLALRKRTTWPVPGSYPGWRVVHMVLGVGLIAVVVAHTGGHWGVNLNGWLLGAFVVTTFTALAGKLAEARVTERLARRPPPASGGALRPSWWMTARVASGRSWRAVRGAMAPFIVFRPPAGPRSPVTRVRAVWLPLHVLVVAALMVLLGFHVFSVYYF
jgi:hypothetical protein